MLLKLKTKTLKGSIKTHVFEFIKPNLYKHADSLTAQIRRVHSKPRN